MRLRRARPCELEGLNVASAFALFQRDYDIAADDHGLLMIKPTDADPTAISQIIVVQHFDEELKRLLPAT